jgi:succinoglycan biosynthesis transport protein ExoP
MSIYQFLSILRARRGLALGIFLLTIGLALAWVLMRPTYYTARAPVLVDIRSADPLAGQSWQPTVPPSYMATQIDIARSERVAQRVVEMLGLEKDPKANEEWRKVTGGRGTVKAWLAADLQSGLEVKPARESNIINISYTAKTPEEAAKVANAFSQAFLDTSVDIKTEPAKGYSTFFDEQLKTAREKLEAAQNKLTAYQQANGVISSDERVDFETARLNELSSQLTLVQGQLTDVSTKRGASRDSVAEVMSSPLINSLKADIARQEARVQEANANLGARHPAMLRMQDELNSMRSRLAAETQSIGNSINTAYEVGRARAGELSGAVQAQRARVMQLNKHRDELSLLRRDVETAQKSFETVSASANTTKLQSLTNQTNIMRLATAVEPMQARGPTRGQALGIAAAGGLLLALAGAILMELLNRRVRSVEDLSVATHLPVLASVPAHSGGGAAALARLGHSGGGRGGRPALAFGGGAA